MSVARWSSSRGVGRQSSSGSSSTAGENPGRCCEIRPRRDGVAVPATARFPHFHTRPAGTTKPALHGIALLKPHSVCCSKALHRARGHGELTTDRRSRKPVSCRELLILNYHWRLQIPLSTCLVLENATRQLESTRRILNRLTQVLSLKSNAVLLVLLAQAAATFVRTIQFASSTLISVWSS